MSQVLTTKYPDAVSSSASPWWPDLGSDERLMEWFYRVKTWRHVIDLYSGLVPFDYNGTYDLLTHDIYQDGASVGTDLPANEKYLMIDPTTGVGWATTFSVLSGFGTIFLRVLGDYYITMSGETEIEWFPEIVFSASTAGLDLDTVNNVGDRLSDATLTVDGISIPLYELDLLPSHTFTGSYTVTPVEWWPYAPTSGGDPVFDSATGAQINPNVLID